MGRNGKIRRAPGFDDRVGSDFERIDGAIRNARDVLYARGYQPIETPLIERTELFLRRSGGLLSSQLFDFTAPDGSEISLRPELTAPVIRHALENDQKPLPWRYQYASPIFRYSERPYDAPPSLVPSKRQFVQVGAELIGASQAAADGEIIATAYTLARRLGIERVSIRIGHVGLIWEVLAQFNLSDRARAFLADHVSTLGRTDNGGDAVENEAIRLGLKPTNENIGVETQASAANLLSRLASGSIQLPNGSENPSRSTDAVVAGLRRKLESNVNNAGFAEALSLMGDLANVSSEAKTVDCPDAIERAKELLLDHGIGPTASAQNFESIIKSALKSAGNDIEIAVDFGLATSMAYYSGMIFEVCADLGDEKVQIGGGGRYDGLAASLGSASDLPALGFALNLDTILELTADVDRNEQGSGYVVLVPVNDASADLVLSAATELLERGNQVVSIFEPDADVECIAESLGGAEVVKVKIVDEDLGTYELVSE